MEKATFLGSICAIIMILGSIIAAKGQLIGFVDPPAAVIIGGGMLFGVMVAFPLDEVKKIPVLIKKVFFIKSRSMVSVVENLVSLAETARRDGVIALEAKMAEIDDPFLKLGISMVVDGMTPENVESVMHMQMDAVNKRHKSGKAIITQMGKSAPVFGLVATLMGLVLMLSNMDPATIGHHMGVAILGTFYGAVCANLFFLPFGEKLAYYNRKEMEEMELTIAGVLAIQHGENPRIIRMKLSTFLTAKEIKPEADDQPAPDAKKA